VNPIFQQLLLLRDAKPECASVAGSSALPVAGLEASTQRKRVLPTAAKGSGVVGATTRIHHKDADGKATGFGKDCINEVNVNCLRNVNEWFDHIVSSILLRVTSNMYNLMRHIVFA
jgi:hypothetical protein